MVNIGVLKTKLLCQGMKIEPGIGVSRGREGGAGPLGQYVIIDGNVVNVPTWGVKKNCFTLIKDKKGRYALMDGEKKIPVEIPPTPRFYNDVTTDGIPMWKIALRHGIDVLASTIYQRCRYWGSKLQCKFCAIENSLKSGNTIEIKSGKHIKEVVEKAWGYGDAKHITFTTGTHPSEAMEVKLMNDACDAVREITDKMKIHAQISLPNDLKLLEKVKCDTIGIHIESFDKTVLKNVCPTKYSWGMPHFFKAMERCVELFGANQVSTFILIGLGERYGKIMEGCERLCRIGVMPFIVPFRPLPNTPFEKKPLPSTKQMLSIQESVGNMMHDYGVDPAKNMAGCVRCGGCSAIGSFVKGG